MEDSLTDARGATGTSVGDLPKVAGFCRSALYSNFTDMDHFVSEVAQIAWDSMFATVEHIPDSWQFTADHPIESAIQILIASLTQEREKYLLWNEFSTF